MISEAVTFRFKANTSDVSQPDNDENDDDLDKVLNEVLKDCDVHVEPEQDDLEKALKNTLRIKIDIIKEKMEVNNEKQKVRLCSNKVLVLNRFRIIISYVNSLVITKVMLYSYPSKFNFTFVIAFPV